jgi:hypothetical protein
MTRPKTKGGSIMRGKLILVVMGVLFFGLMAADVHAFCIYNQTDTTIKVDQASGYGNYSARFYQWIAPNNNGCCTWQFKTCNSSGKSDGIVAFAVYYLSKLSWGMICYVEIQAGGWLTVEGSNGNYRCVRHDYQ